MKLSCLPVSFFDQIINQTITIEEWASMAKIYGYDAIDISILFIREIESITKLEKIRKSVEEVGMQIAMVTTYPDFTHPNSAERARQLELAKKYIKYSAAVGAQAVRLTSGQAHPGLEMEKGLEWALEGLMGCEKTAREKNIQLLLENHGKPGVWQYPDFDQKTEVFLHLARSIKNTSIKINFDTANPVVGKANVVELMESVMGQIGWIHIADTDNADTLNHVVIGTGLVPFREVFSSLKQHGYNGWLSIEEGSGLGETGIVAAAEYVRHAWNEV